MLLLLPIKEYSEGPVEIRGRSSDLYAEGPGFVHGQSETAYSEGLRVLRVFTGFCVKCE